MAEAFGDCSPTPSVNSTRQRRLQHYDVHKALEPASKAAKLSDEKIDELRFEFVGVYLSLYDEPNVWGTY